MSKQKDEQEKAELIALVKQLTPEELDRVVCMMKALLSEQQSKQEVVQ